MKSSIYDNKYRLTWKVFLNESLIIKCCGLAHFRGGKQNPKWKQAQSHLEEGPDIYKENGKRKRYKNLKEKNPAKPIIHFFPGKKKRNKMLVQRSVPVLNTFRTSLYYYPKIFSQFVVSLPTSSFSALNNSRRLKAHKIRAFATATAAAAGNGSDADTFLAEESVSWASLGISDSISHALSNVGLHRPSLVQVFYFILFYLLWFSGFIQMVKKLLLFGTSWKWIIWWL